MTVTPQTNVTLESMADVIRTHDDFVICGHVSPDGDCIGSQLALWHALAALGKNATCLLVKDDPLPASLTFLPGAEDMVPAVRFTGKAQTFIGLDVPSRERVGEAACDILDSCSCSVTIDHHAYPTTMCEYVYVDPDSASASMLVWKLVTLLCEDAPMESALCAYTGLVTDTGGFRYQNTDKHAFEIASELVARGVDVSHVANCVFQNRTYASMMLESLAVSRMITNESGDYALSWITKNDMQEHAAKKYDTEPLIDALRSLQGVRVACMMREEDGKTRISLRAKDDTDVSTLARKLGGGGHRAAAGATLDVPIDQAIEFMCEQLDMLTGEQGAE